MLSRLFLLALVLPTLVAHGGAASNAGQQRDLATAPADVTIYGQLADLLGYSVIAADLNADGKDDLIISAPTGVANPGSGAVHVFFGADTFPRSFDLAAGDANANIVNSAGPGQVGYSTAAGDFNGDGTADLLIGAPGGNGEAYIVLGSPAFGGTIDLATTQPALSIIGADYGDQLGYSVAAGDITGDGIDDAIVAALDADGPDELRPGAGEVYVVYGSPAISGVRRIALSEQDVTVVGTAEGDELGYVVSAGDLDGGQAELLLGAPEADAGGRDDSGAVYAIGGLDSMAPHATIDLAVDAPNLTINGADDGDEMGYSLASGDFTGDGFDDILMGAYYADGPGATPCPDVPSGPHGGAGSRCRSGEAYVITGSDSLLPVIDLADENDAFPQMTVFGADVGDELSYSQASGDINGDGRDDIVLGARYADGPGNAVCPNHPLEAPSLGAPGRCQSGEAYVIFGSPVLTPELDLSVAGAAGLTLAGRQWLAHLGYTPTLGSGDLDGDGRDDLLLSAPYANGPAGARIFAGEVYVVFSRETDGDGLGNPVDNCPTVGNAEQADAGADGIGDACDAGDFDGDFHPDSLEHFCGSSPADPAASPERTDGVFAGRDDDRDSAIDEPLPLGAAQYDCDRDGFAGSREAHIGTSDRDPCGATGWPADLNGAGGSANRLNLPDITSFIAPSPRKLGTSSGDNGFSARWDLTPGATAGKSINLQDMVTIVPGVISAPARPPMFGGNAAFGRVCPWPQ